MGAASAKRSPRWGHHPQRARGQFDVASRLVSRAALPLYALVLTAAGCGGARPAPASSFADLERCVGALEEIAASKVEYRVKEVDEAAKA